MTPICAMSPICAMTRKITALPLYEVYVAVPGVSCSTRDEKDWSVSTPNVHLSHPHLNSLQFIVP